MEHSKAYHWLKQGKRRRKILLAIRQPMTARQLSQHTGIALDTCSLVLKELAGSGLVTCLNDRARRSRLYWLTQPGKQCQSRLQQERGLGVLRNDIPIVDWELYGWVCFSHRAAVLAALREPMQPSQNQTRSPFPRSGIDNERQQRPRCDQTFPGERYR